jgi:hypothetical protein
VRLIHRQQLSSTSIRTTFTRFWRCALCKPVICTNASVDRPCRLARVQELFTGLLFKQPAEPLRFISSECERLHSERAHKQPVSSPYPCAIVIRVKRNASLRASCVQSTPFSEADLRAMHSLFDPSGTGSISSAQVATAFRNLGLKQAPKVG